MFKHADISKHIRVAFTAISLLLVIALNNREITTYVAAPAAEKTGHQVSEASKKGTVVKQKIYFEATASYIVLELAAACPELLRVTFQKPLVFNVPLYRLSGAISNVCRLFFATAIQPNAP